MRIFSIFVIFGISALLSINLASAVFIKSVNTPTLQPGEGGTIRVEIENVFEDDIEEVTFGLDFTNIPLTPIGSSEDSVDKLDENEDASFVFELKVANDIIPGDYEIPYTITFERNGDLKTRTGSLGVRVSADTELDFSASGNNNVIGEQGEISLRIVNTGFGDVKFVNVKVIPEGFALLSENEIYVGTVDSDDFETAIFEVKFEEENARLIAIVEYRDFDNNKIASNVNIPLQVYSRKRALELGIIKNSSSPLILGIAVLAILSWILFRMWRKSRRVRNSKKSR